MILYQFLESVHLYIYLTKFLFSKFQEIFFTFGAPTNFSALNLTLPSWKNSDFTLTKKLSHACDTVIFD